MEDFAASLTGMLFELKYLWVQILVSPNKTFEDIRDMGNGDEHHVHLIDRNTIHYLTI